MADDSNSPIKPQKDAKPASNPQKSSTKKMNPDGLLPDIPLKTYGAKDIIDKLTSEGQLIRNTGQNSLRSVNANLEKFQGVFDSISKEMSVQTVTLKAILNDNSVERARRKVEEDQNRILESERAEREKNSPSQNNQNGSSGGIKQDKEEKGGFISSLLGGGWIAALLGIPVRAMLGISAVVGSDMVVEYLSKKVQEWGVPQQIAEAIAAPLKNGAIWGSLGLVISKRFGVYGLVAGMAWPMAEKILDIAGIKDTTLMGLNLSDIFGAVLAGGAVYLTKQLMTPGAFTEIFTNKSFRFGLSKMKLGIAGLISTALVLIQEPLTNALTSMGMEKDFANMVVTDGYAIAQFATLGGMFGPQGALAGAAVGLVYVLGKHMYDWLNGSKDTITSQIDEATKTFEKMQNTDNILTKTEMDTVTAARQRALEAGNQAAVDMWDEILKVNQDRGGQTPISADVKKGFKDYLDKNSEEITQDLDGIMTNPDTSEAQKRAQGVDYVRGIQKQFPALTERQISIELKKSVGNTSWVGADGRDLAFEMSNQDFWDVKTKNGSKTSQEGRAEIAALYARQHNGKRLDFNSDEGIEWLNNTPEAADFLNAENMQKNPLYDMDYNTVAPFKPIKQLEGESDATFEDRKKRDIASDRSKLNRMQGMIDQNAVEYTAKKLDKMGITSIRGGDTNHINVTNTTGGSDNSTTILAPNVNGGGVVGGIGSSRF